jgi:hypothetical protein
MLKAAFGRSRIGPLSVGISKAELSRDWMRLIAANSCRSIVATRLVIDRERGPSEINS